MPYNANSSQIIYLTNPSTDAVDVNVKAYDDSGNQFDLGVIVQAPGRTVTKLASQLSTALANAGFNGGKVTLEFNLSNAAAHIYFSYNASSVRGYVAPIRELYPLPQQSANTMESAALGVKITCPYMPYNATSSQIIYLTNPSTNAVDVNVKAYDESGNQFDLGVIVQAPGRTVTKLASLLSTALANADFNDGKVTFEFNLSNAAAHAYFSCNEDSVRGYVAPIRDFCILPSENP